MRTYSIVFLMLLVISGCDYIKNYDKPKLELTESPYRLTISDFQWSHGMVEFGKYSGDFEKLDHKVFNLLKGKTGTYTVYMNSQSKDKYGSEKTESQLIGELDLQELNKYESWEYWHKNAGIMQLLNQKYFPERSKGLKYEEMDSIRVAPENAAINPAKTVIEPNNTNTGRIFRYNSMIGMPWTHYKVTEEGLEELRPPDEELFSTISFWAPFVDKIEDMTVIAYDKTANLKIKMPENEKSFTLLKTEANLFVHAEDPYIALAIVSFTECVIFFKNGDTCVGIRNKSILEN